MNAHAIFGWLVLISALWSVCEKSGVRKAHDRSWLLIAHALFGCENWLILVMVD
jgi:hypothetical protein